MKSNRSRYLRDLRRLMPVYGKSQREYLHAIDQSIQDYCNSHPNPTYEELTDHFGAPQEIIGDYLREQDTNMLIHQIGQKHSLQMIVRIFCIAAILCSAFFWYYCYRSYLNCKQSTPAYYYEEIEIIDQSTKTN